MPHEEKCGLLHNEDTDEDEAEAETTISVPWKIRLFRSILA